MSFIYKQIAPYSYGGYIKGEYGDYVTIKNPSKHETLLLKLYNLLEGTEFIKTIPAGESVIKEIEDTFKNNNTN